MPVSKLAQGLFLLTSLCIGLSSCSSVGEHSASDNLSSNTSDAPSSNGQSPFQLGMSYLSGQGVPQNDSQAFRYFSQAAAQGDPAAENQLGYMYAAGKGTTQDYQQAIYWYQKAAADGIPSAEESLRTLQASLAPATAVDPA